MMQFALETVVPALEIDQVQFHLLYFKNILSSSHVKKNMMTKLRISVTMRQDDHWDILRQNLSLLSMHLVPKNNHIKALNGFEYVTSSSLSLSDSLATSTPCNSLSIEFSIGFSFLLSFKSICFSSFL